MATDVCNELLEMLQSLFVNESLFSGLDSESLWKKRLALSRPIVNRIFDKTECIARDATLMGKVLLKKAVSYIINEKESLRNFLLDGKAELSNNYCEQRMKSIKLDMKTCQNIGSEEAADGAAFIHSLVESYRMNGKTPYDYLVDLLRKVGKPLDDL